MKKNILFLSASLAIATAFQSCQQGADPKMIAQMNMQMDSMANAKLDEMRMMKMNECYDQVMSAAKMKADSMMLAMNSKGGKKTTPKPKEETKIVDPKGDKMSGKTTNTADAKKDKMSGKTQSTSDSKKDKMNPPK